MPEVSRKAREKVAVILFNLGGPDQPEAVKPFLFNLFNDPAIISLPNPLRWMIAKLISGRRAPVAREIYAHIGGKSPLLEQTADQARVLEGALSETADVKCFIAMRYWHPMSDETARNVKKWGPDRVILLPLYPQYSTTTSGSSVKDWGRAARAAELDVSTQTICCYPQNEKLAEAHADLIEKALKNLDNGTVRILFSAHGLPRKVIEKGDPYQAQVEATVETVVKRLGTKTGENLPEHVICYQSRVGPMEWIGPATDFEIERAGKDGKAIVIVPIAFVSEHSETLVELDIEYKKLAEEKGIPAYIRVPALMCHPVFISGLANLVENALNDKPVIGQFCGRAGRSCPALVII